MLGDTLKGQRALPSGRRMQSFLPRGGPEFTAEAAIPMDRRPNWTRRSLSSQLESREQL